jgi:hypothetical protein
MLVIFARLALCLPSWKRSRFGSVSPEYQDMCGLPSVHHKLPSPFWPTFLRERFFGQVVGRQGARPIERGHAVTSHERRSASKALTSTLQCGGCTHGRPTS